MKLTPKQLKALFHALQLLAAALAGEQLGPLGAIFGEEKPARVVAEAPAAPKEAAAEDLSAASAVK